MMQLHAPQHIKTVDREEFQVRGSKKKHGCILDAITEAKVRGVGSEVVRLSDGKTVATVPGRIPATPRY